MAMSSSVFVKSSTLMIRFLYANFCFSGITIVLTCVSYSIMFYRVAPSIEISTVEMMCIGGWSSVTGWVAGDSCTC